ncbi:hypothetical protein SVIOM74S_09661 [Streptomyces violarus]
MKGSPPRPTRCAAPAASPSSSAWTSPTPRPSTTPPSRSSDTFGPIDVWVNNAFTGVFAPFTEIGPDEFRRVTEVTYLGYVFGTRAALRHMLPRDRGTIVQVGSALAYRGIPLQSAYCGAKHAIQGVQRVPAVRTAARAQWGVYDDGAAPRRQHPAVRVGAEPMKGRARPVAPVYAAVRSLGEADRIDLDGQTLHYTGPEGEGGTLAYNRLVLAAGSVNKLLPIPGRSPSTRTASGGCRRRCTCATT